MGSVRSLYGVLVGSTGAESSVRLQGAGKGVEGLHPGVPSRDLQGPHRHFRLSNSSFSFFFSWVLSNNELALSRLFSKAGIAPEAK